LKIAVYAVALNEEDHVQRFCDSAREADLIVVADTGSADSTRKILLAHAVTVHDIRVKPWRFDDARNACLALLPEDIDVCVSLDLDEVLQPGWRQEIERVWTPGRTTRLRYGFDWGLGIVYQYEKIHARFGYRWHHPCHEYPVPDRIDENWANTDKLLVVHQPDREKSRGQYLELLKQAVDEDPTCPRSAFYYGRELSFYRQWQASIDACKRYLALPGANWVNERCYALRVISRCHQELGNYTDGLRYARLATAEAPDTREPWCELAAICYRLSRWEESLGSALTALKITHRELVYTVDPAVWGAQPHDYASIAAYNLALWELALHHAQEAVKLDSDPRLKANLEFCTRKLQEAA
jgi:tetratricopeptide (TPR) repeat protein